MIDIETAALALAGAFAVSQFAVEVPYRIHLRWHEDAAEIHDKFPGARPPARADFALPLVARAAIVAAALAFAVLVVVMHGAANGAWAWCAYAYGLVLLAAIGVRHQLLPDMVVYPLLWGGLLFNVVLQPGQGGAAFVWGAIVAYLVPWALVAAVRWRTGKLVLGHGDLKALAMAGAWFGLDAVPSVLGFFVLGTLAQGVALAVLRRSGTAPVPTGLVHLGVSVALLCGLRLLSLG